MNLQYISILLTSIAGLLVIIKELKIFEDRIPNWIFVVVIIGTLVAIAVTNIYIEKQQEEKEKYSKYSGEIPGVLENKSIVYPCIKIGEAKFIWEGPKGYPIFTNMGMDPIKIWIEDGKLKISLVVRDENGKVIAWIEGNEWQINQNLILDRNFDDNAVEVINDKKEVVLQAEFDGECVELAGIFYNESGWKVALYPYSEGGVIEIRPPDYKFSFSIEHIFKYPSDRHPGERV